MAIKGLDERLRKLREEEGISQKELAVRVGVKENTISSYETGNATPKAVTLMRLATTFKCSSDYLLGIDNHRTVRVDNLDDEALSALQTIINKLESK